jgi:ribosomal-protein-alanine N-acetyltransferase
MEIAFRPVVREDLEYLRRFECDPEWSGYNFYGFRGEGSLERRFAENGLISDEYARLIVMAEKATVGFVAHSRKTAGLQSFYWEIGIVLEPQFRGRGIGWRAQAMLADYLFAHTPAQRVEAGTQPENIAEQKALVKAGFQLEGVVRSVEFRAGQWRDGLLYSRLRDDPAPTL